MGAKDSKPSFLSYEEASKRISEAELKRIEDAFKKCAGSVGAPLSKGIFVQEVLGEGVPHTVGEWLFTTCGGTRRGISFKDLVCGLVLLTKGTQEERIKFLWTLYSNDTGTHITKWDFIKALQAENASLHPPGVRPLCIASSESLSALFGRNSERADFEQFRTWVSQRKDATVLSRWMLLDQRVSLTSELETPTFYQTLAGVTHLEERDIIALEKCFWSLQSRSLSGQLDLDVLAPLLSPPLPRAALPGLFAALDENRDGHIDFKELCCGLSAACRGPECERIKFCFKVFDCDRDGFLNQEELRHMCNILTFVANESLRNEPFNGDRAPYNADTVYEALQDMVGGAPRKRSKRSSSEKPHLGLTRGDSDVAKDDNTEKSSLDNNRVLNINNNNNNVNLLELRDKESLEAEEYGGEKEWGLSQEDFLIWSVERASALVAPLLTLINQVAHVVLGLRPLCRHHEKEIVLGWLNREVRRGYSVGQFWYLISTKWWNSWLSYTSSSGTNGSSNGRASCSACGKRPPSAHTPPVDEAIVCDESFNSSEGMVDSVSVGSSNSSSGVSSGSSRSANRPGTIFNSNLLQQSPYKVRSLTGEGGYLRRDVTLSQHIDFELVPESLWKALAQWYSGPQPLPRQVIQPLNSDVELELYPKTLRLYRHAIPGQQNSNSGQPQSSWSGMVGGYGAAALSSVGMASYQSTTPAQPTKYLAYTAAFSRLATIRQVCEFICSQLGLPREDVRLWLMGNGTTGASTTGGSSSGELLEEEGLSLSQLKLEEGHRLLLEIRNKDLTWPEEMGALSGLAAMGGVGRGSLAGLTVSTIPHPAGATGLHNLGNTCFMNAALQAVWNTGPLTMYFTRDMHLYEVNKENPDGTGGALAQRYGELCKDVWCSGARSVAPLRVRWCIIKHASRFGGGGQHDSQELLAWLLDALHEDLNRAPPPAMVPYTELRDSGGRPDQEVAQEAWELHTARNQSIITDLFYGQLKSKVTCSVCGHESVKFDAFNMLSLPLPMENYIVVEVTVTLLDGSVPVRYGIRLNSESRYGEVKERMSSVCGLPASCMLLVLAGWPPCVPYDSHKITTPHCTIYQTPPPTLLTQVSQNGCNKDIGTTCGNGVAPTASTNNGSGEVVVGGGNGGGERSSISSDYGGSPATPNYLNSKNIRSLDSNNDSSGYNSIQDIDVHNHIEGGGGTPPAGNYFASSHNNNNNNSLKKSNHIHSNSVNNNHVKNTNVKGSPSPSVKSLNASPMIRKKFDNNESSVINRGRSEEILLHPTKSNKNSPMLSARKDVIDGDVSSNSSTVRWDDDQEPAVKNYLLAVHRKQSRQESYFLSQQKRRWETFGSPIVVGIREGCGGRELYGAVWRQVERLLSAPPPQPPDQANHATDCDDSLGYTFPFTLRVVGPRALRCAVCPWTSFCRGCALPCTDDPLITNLYSYSSSPVHSYPATHHIVEESTGSAGDGGIRESVVSLLDMAQLRDGEVYLAVDWEPTALHLRYQSNREKMVVEHESVRECRAGATAPVQLQHCLHSFTQEEKLGEGYACAKCSQPQPATKKLQIWRLPPVLIIHLKRFQFVNRKWIKSHKAVNFPFQDFDPTSFLASVPQETILRHAEVKQHRTNKLLLHRGSHILSEDEESDSKANVTDQMIAEEVLEGLEFNAHTDDELQSEDDAYSAESVKNKTGSKNVGSRKGSVIASTRERLVSTSLSKTPVVDDEFVDFHEHKLKTGEDPFNLKYRLYAVVSHSGMMNGGHYVAYARNPTGTWYCYNDSSCRELNGAPNPSLDPSTAYLLFYERLGLDHAAYLPDIQERLPRMDTLTQLAEGEDADLKKMCSIS